MNIKKPIIKFIGILFSLLLVTSCNISNINKSENISQIDSYFNNNSTESIEENQQDSNAINGSSVSDTSTLISSNSNIVDSKEKSNISSNSSSKFTPTLTPNPIPTTIVIKNDVFPYLNSGVMPIGAYVGPPPANVAGTGNLNYITNDSYKNVAESGINIIYGLYERGDSNLQEVLNAYKYAEANGIKYLPKDLKTKAGSEFPEAMEESLLAYNKEKAFIGNLVYDEPSSAYFEELGKSFINYKKISPNSIFYINILPMYASKAQLTIDVSNGTPGEATLQDYQNYVDSFVSIVKPQMISYDYYPLQGSFPSLESTYYKNMSIIRKAAINAKIPFWVYIQTTSYGQLSRVPKEAEIQWQVNSSLAYGAKGIQYFCYWTPVEVAEFRGSMVTRTGVKNPTYFYAQTMNKQIVAIDDVLMNCKSIGVMQLNDSPVPIPTEDKLNGYKELTTLSGDAPAIVGCFDNNGKSVYYVVNNTINKSGTVTLNFNKSINSSIIQKAVKSQKSGSSITLELTAGEGALVTIN